MPIIEKLLLESGSQAFFSSSVDVKLLCLQRFCRLFAYGATFIILIQFLTLIGNTDEQVGLFMTLTLLGDTLISLVLSWITDRRVGRRRVLAAGSILMIGSGATFSLTSNYWALLVSATFGVISPSGNEIGPFRAVEESILSQLTKENERSDIFAWYNMGGTAGAAIGTLLSGWTIQFLQNHTALSLDTAYRVIFVLYALLGLFKLGLTLALTRAVEPETFAYQALDDEAEFEERRPVTDGDGSPRSSSTPVIEDDPHPEQVRPPESSRSILSKLTPGISRKSLSTLLPLLFLFSLDSTASGLASPSWLTYFFTTYHSLPPSYLGTLFFATNIIATISNLVALPIARRLGPLRTMVFTHFPSAIFLGMIPVPGRGNPGTSIAVLFLFLRACTQSMDQAPRQAFIAAAVSADERTAVLGTVNTAKTMAQAAGTGMAGILAERRWWTLLFGSAGFGKATYDLLLLWLFHRAKR